jgi:hypothetical protein
MEMFKQFLKSFHEDNIDTKEDGEENSGASFSPTVDSLFGHDLFCAQDSIPGMTIFLSSTIDSFRFSTIDLRFR